MQCIVSVLFKYEISLTCSSCFTVLTQVPFLVPLGAGSILIRYVNSSSQRRLSNYMSLAGMG